MSAISLILLLAAGLALAVCTAALRAARGLRAEVAALRAQLGLSVLPQARTAPDEELIRAAVADALADERDRELAEARAFWAEQEARDAENAAFPGHPGTVTPTADELLLDALLERYLTDGDQADADGRLMTATDFGGYGPDVDLAGYDPYDDTEPTVPGQDSRGEESGHRDRLGRRSGAVSGETAPNTDDERAADSEHTAAECERRDGEPGERAEGPHEDTTDTAPQGPAFLPRQSQGDGVPAGDSPDEDGRRAAEVAAARRRHPSHPGYNLSGEPVQSPVYGPDTAEEYEHTTERLSRLAQSGTPLADVRPGPLGTLDVFLFEDGTTLCLSPGHRETSQRLASAVRSGESPVLLGGSGVSGAYALTFGCGEESIYLLADRIVAA
ncbi:hypothetical protein [Streptomyces sp. SM12]|uniref:hypothetical protein n=1 Tax=Streptomyces sp. SM12 TaxID=1071602 RepID=UPI000CD56F6C|nr:hypothetical protein [Streptomyces sp. SM12]